MITMTEYAREEVVAGLKSGFAMVAFDKANGEQRVMRCTLDPQFLPEMAESTGAKKAKPVNDEVVSVWDMDKSAWRAFRLDSIQKIDFYPVK